MQEISYKQLLSNINLGPGRCWNWKGSLASDGYGRTRHKGKVWPAHRLSYVIFSDDYDIDKYDIHHKCRNKACINPAHLEKLN